MNTMMLPGTMRMGFGPVACALSIVLSFGSAQDRVASAPDDDPEERLFLRATAQRAVRENCYFCHSDDLIVSQRLTPTQWKAEVEKMVGWGSPLPKEDHAKVIAYLAEEYSVSKAKSKPLSIKRDDAIEAERPETTLIDKQPEKAVVHGDASIGGTTFARDCATCHGANAQGQDLGPNLVEKPILLRPTEFRKVVREGKGRMPGFASVQDQTSYDNVLIWIRSRRYEPPALK